MTQIKSRWHLAWRVFVPPLRSPQVHNFVRGDSETAGERNGRSLQQGRHRSRGEEAAVAGIAVDSRHSFAVQFDPGFGHVRGSFRSASSSRCFHGDLLDFGHRFQRAGWNGKRTGYIMWSGLWCKADMVGIHMQRAMFILLLVCIPLAFIWANTDHILVLLQQDPNVSAEAGLFARWMIPSVSAHAILQCLFRFLQSQHKIFPMMISTGITALLHILLCWILVIKFRLVGNGPALAIAISYWLNVFLLAHYVKFSSACEKTWTGFSKAAMHNTMRFVRLAVPSACMICMRSWTLQLMVFMSGLLPEAKFKTSVMSIGLNTSTLLFTIPLALGNTVSVRVSNELGSGHPKAAYLSVFVVAAMTFSVCTILDSAILSVRNIFGYAYSNDEEVVKCLASLITFIAITNLLDGIQSVLSGSLRGCGWQKIGAFVNLGAYYLVGLPLCALLAFFFGAGVKGLWMGIISGLSTQSVLLLLLTLRINWEQEVKRAQERVKNSSIPVATA